jgi:predicted phosphate transport protein (TIGR00153 family)
MGFASILRFLLPREERFRELLEQATANLVKASELFLAIAHARDVAERRVKLVELKAVEHQGDKITRRIFEALNSTFITPFDREDIRAIAVDVDDALDYLEGIGQFIVLFEMDESPEPLTRFAEILRDLCRQIEELTELIWDLSNATRIQEGMVHISDLENQADALYLTSLGTLFRKDNGMDAREVMKWNKIYQDLEDACDKCKDFTHVLGNVVIKNA